MLVPPRLRHATAQLHYRDSFHCRDRRLWLALTRAICFLKCFRREVEEDPAYRNETCMVWCIASCLLLQYVQYFCSGIMRSPKETLYCVGNTSSCTKWPSAESITGQTIVYFTNTKNFSLWTTFKIVKEVKFCYDKYETLYGWLFGFLYILENAAWRLPAPGFMLSHSGG